MPDIWERRPRSVWEYLMALESGWTGLASLAKTQGCFLLISNPRSRSIYAGGTFQPDLGTPTAGIEVQAYLWYLDPAD